MHLRRLGAFDGEVPQYGDWDEGRVLADSQLAGSVAGSAWAALALSGYTVPDSAFDAFDEVAWYVAKEATRFKVLDAVPAYRQAGHFHVFSDGDLHVWVKTSTTASHQHADIGSVWVRRGQEWIVRDPGTGTYNGPLNVRNGFRTLKPIRCGVQKARTS